MMQHFLAQEMLKWALLHSSFFLYFYLIFVCFWCTSNILGCFKLNMLPLRRILQSFPTFPWHRQPKHTRLFYFTHTQYVQMWTHLQSMPASSQHTSICKITNQKVVAKILPSIPGVAVTWLGLCTCLLAVGSQFVTLNTNTIFTRLSRKSTLSLALWLRLSWKLQMAEAALHSSLSP